VRRPRKGGAKPEKGGTAAREGAKGAKGGTAAREGAKGAKGAKGKSKKDAPREETPRKRPLEVRKRKSEAHPGHRGSAVRIAALRAQAAPPVGPKPFDVFAIAAPGLAPLVAAECVAMGYAPTDVSAAGVSLALLPDDLFLLNARLRVASRVLVRLAEFEARDFATLEKAAAKLPWGRFVAPGMAVRLRVTCRKSRLYHSDAVAERVARGIAGAVDGVTVGTRAPADDDDAADVASGASGTSALPQLVVVRLEHDVCTISVDSSGALLHRRGWRQAVAKAPLRETLAAAMLAGCAWQRDEALVDPFCGSGTIGIEAALLARNIAPGLSRSYAMEAWPGASAEVFAAHRLALRRQVKPRVGAPIVLRDRDAGAIAAARANAERAGVLADVDIAQGPLSALALADVAAAGLVCTNPPYGLRVSEGGDLRGLFARLGDVVRAGGDGWRLGLLMPADKALLGQLRVPLRTALTTSNGGIGVGLVLKDRG